MLADLNHAPRIAVGNGTGQHTEVPMATATLKSISLAERTSESAATSTRIAESAPTSPTLAHRAIERWSITWRYTSD